jgi:hypothetical protein
MHWLTLSALGLSACNTLDTLLANGPESFVSTTQWTEANHDDVRQMADFWVPSPVADGAASERMQERCARGEDVRHLWPGRYAIVELQPGAVRVSGKVISVLDGWLVPPNTTRGMMIMPLFDAVSEMVDDHHRAIDAFSCWPTFSGEVLLVVDPNAPTSLLRQVMYTLGQARYHEFLFAVSNPEAEPPDSAAKAKPQTLHRPTRACVDVVELRLDSGRKIHVIAKPHHGGVLKPESAGASTVLAPSAGTMNLDGLHHWVGQQISGSSTAGMDWHIKNDGSTPVGEAILLESAILSKHPGSGIVIVQGESGSPGLAGALSGVAIGPLSPSDWVAVVPATTPAIRLPDEQCIGADGRDHPSSARAAVKVKDIQFMDNGDSLSKAFSRSLGLGGTNNPAPALRGTLKHQVEISGDIDGPLFRRLVKRRLTQVQGCFVAATGSEGSEGSPGRVGVEGVVTEGRLRNLRLRTRHAKAVDDCVLAKVKRWRFNGAGDGEFVLSFDFEGA